MDAPAATTPLERGSRTRWRGSWTQQGGCRSGRCEQWCGFVAAVCMLVWVVAPVCVMVWVVAAVCVMVWVVAPVCMMVWVVAAVCVMV